MTDCVLPETGGDSSALLAVAVVVVLVGAALLALAVRRRKGGMRGAGAALLVAAVALGGFGLSAPPASAATGECVGVAPTTPVPTTSTTPVPTTPACALPDASQLSIARVRDTSEPDGTSVIEYALSTGSLGPDVAISTGSASWTFRMGVTAVVRYQDVLSGTGVSEWESTESSSIELFDSGTATANLNGTTLIVTQRPVDRPTNDEIDARFGAWLAAQWASAPPAADGQTVTNLWRTARAGGHVQSIEFVLTSPCGTTSTVIDYVLPRGGNEGGNN